MLTHDGEELYFLLIATNLRILAGDNDCGNINKQAGSPPPPPLTRTPTLCPLDDLTFL
jgi:hypothetical protein